MKKAVLQDRVDLTLNLSNLFSNYFLYRSGTQYFDERTEYHSYQRAFRLGCTASGRGSRAACAKPFRTTT